MKTERDYWISIIEALYPADCQYPDTAEVGKQLLAKARERVGDNWRNESDEVLRQYASLCQAEDSRQTAWFYYP